MQAANSAELWKWLSERRTNFSSGLEEQHSGRTSYVPPRRQTTQAQHCMTPDLETEGGLPFMDLMGALPLSPGQPSSTGEGDQLGSQLTISGQEKCSPSSSGLKPPAWRRGDPGQREPTTSSLIWETVGPREPETFLPDPETPGPGTEETPSAPSGTRTSGSPSSIKWSKQTQIILSGLWKLNRHWNHSPPKTPGPTWQT